ncbi:reverse transcriptase domain-containing protein [Tanacetum coccineum]
MPIEFVVLKNSRTFPKSQELPEVYEDLAYNGKREIYLTSPRRNKVKVEIIKKHDGPIIMKGYKWEKFAEENFNMNVKLLHFVEEGEDSFYVTGYDENGREAIGYADLDIRNRFPGFMTWVLPYSGLVPMGGDKGGHKGQTFNEAFIKKMPVDKHIKIKANWVTYNVKLSRGRVGNGTQYEYKIHADSWKRIEHDLGLEPGMTVVFTKKRSDKYWLTAFYEDGSASTVVNFHGAIRLRNVQPDLSFWEKADDRMLNGILATLLNLDELAVPNTGIQKVYEFKRFLNRLNDDDVIVVSHEDAQATFGDTNDPFTFIQCLKILRIKIFQLMMHINS